MPLVGAINVGVLYMGTSSFPGETGDFLHFIVAMSQGNKAGETPTSPFRLQEEFSQLPDTG